MATIVFLSFLTMITGRVVIDNTVEERLIDTEEHLMDSNIVLANVEYKNGEIDKLTYSYNKDFDTALNLYKASVISGRINESNDFSCFNDLAVKSTNYIGFLTNELKVLRSFRVGMQKKVEFTRIDSLEDSRYTRGFNELNVKFKKVIQKKCFVHINREFKLRDFFLIRASRDTYYVVSEVYE